MSADVPDGPAITQSGRLFFLALAGVLLSISMWSAADQDNEMLDQINITPIGLASAESTHTRLEKYSKLCHANQSRYLGDALTIENLNLTMCPDELVETIKRQTDLKPVNVDIPGVCVFYTEAGAVRGKGILGMCDDEGKLMALMLSCNVTNTCVMSVQEIARSIIDALPGLDEMDVSNDQHAMFEGRARTGETIKLNAIKEVLIERGLLGTSDS